MSKGKFAKNGIRKILIWLLLISLALFAVTAYFAFVGFDRKDPNAVNKTDPVHNQTDINEQADDLPTDGDTIAQTEGTAEPSETAPAETQVPPTEPPQTEVQETRPPVVIVQKADAVYERWLAAALVVGVSMEYPDFIPDGIYAASATGLEEKFTSDGVYIVFMSGGSMMGIHAKPLQQERTEAGTKDISTHSIGFATFDQIDPASINVDSMERIELEDLGELIAQSLLISIYTH